MAPSEVGMVRQVDYDHVNKLEKSFRDNSTQISMLAGHVRQKVPMEVLAQPGRVSVEVLGGNHTRLALQSLHDKGLLLEPLIRMTIYFTDVEQLQIGVHHNEILKESKPMTFMEKAALMRSRQPEGFRKKSQGDVDSWKKELQVIFSCAVSYYFSILLTSIIEKGW